MPRVGQLVSGLLDGLGLSHRCRQQAALHIWAEVVGPVVAQNTSPEAVRNGTLYVRTASSTWTHELTMGFRHIYLRELNRRLGGEVLTDLRFLPPPLKPEAASSPTQPRLDLSGPLDPSEQAWVESQLASIDDDELRPRFKRLLGRVAKLERARRRAGYKPCPGCGELYADERLCMHCRWKLKHERRLVIHRLLVQQPWLRETDVRAQVEGSTPDDYRQAKQHLLHKLHRTLLDWHARQPAGVLLGGEMLTSALSYCMLRSAKMPSQLAYSDIRRALGPELGSRYQDRTAQA